jgi:ATP synthase F1 delta subunit
MEQIATVYARSLFEVAQQDDKLNLVKDQLGQVADALDGDRDLSLFFFSPYFSTEEKKAGLRKVVVDADPVVLNFLELLVENHRMPAIFRTRKRYDQLWDDENKLLPVQLTSAVTLDRSTADQLGAAIEKSTGRKVELTSEVDPDLLGGIVLRVGNSILDASIRNRLELLRKQVARG